MQDRKRKNLSAGNWKLPKVRKASSGSEIVTTGLELSPGLRKAFRIQWFVRFAEYKHGFAWICMDLHGFAWIEHGFGMDLATFALSYLARAASAPIFGLFGGV